jgi:hypothetical protein
MKRKLSIKKTIAKQRVPMANNSPYFLYYKIKLPLFRLSVLGMN